MSTNFHSELETTIVELEYATKIQAYLEELDKSEISLSDHISSLTRTKLSLEETIEAADAQKKIQRETNRLDRRFGRAISNMPKLKIVRPESEDEPSDKTPTDS